MPGLVPRPGRQLRGSALARPQPRHVLARVYADVVTEVRDELTAGWTPWVHAGVDPGCVVLDRPGVRQAPEHNWPLLSHLGELGTLPGPVTRPGRGVKEGLPGSCWPRRRHARAVAERDQATVAITAWPPVAGAWWRARPPGSAQRGRGPGRGRLAASAPAAR